VKGSYCHEEIDTYYISSHNVRKHLLVGLVSTQLSGCMLCTIYASFWLGSLDWTIKLLHRMWWGV